MKWADRIYFGGDYNPDQWDAATIDEDMRLFKKAGINLLVLPVFSWAKLEPEEGVYNFGWLDEIIEKIWANGIKVCLATPTVAQPAWLSTRYPEVLPVDIAGRRRTHGMRVMFCVNSQKYRERAAAIAEEFARRYAHHPALAMWHVANEYGTYCYCPVCQAKFRLWLKSRYGSVDGLNERWHTSFWGRTLTSFEEITLPSELNDDYRFNPAIQLDYMRFMTDSTAECFCNERDVLKRYNPEIPVQTNMSGYIKKLDQYVMTKNLDIVGWDNYPPPYFVAMKHDIMRGLKGGRSFLLAEQSPNQQNWQPYNKLKRPGEVRRLTYQALAHGADSCLFFQMRQSIAGQEKFHGAVISHSGREDTRVFRETVKLGHELEKLGDRFLQARTEAKTAILFDWNNWWALENSSGPSKDMDYLKTVSKYYEAFYCRNIPVDIINPAEPFAKYDLIVAPMLYMTKEGVAERLTEYVRAGGSLLATVMSGLVDENDRCVFGAYPGKLREVLGIWVEETDALRPEEKNGIRLTKEGEGSDYRCGFLCDLLHTETAAALAVYTDDFYAGMPCVTENAFGAGKAYYIGTEPDEAFLKDFLGGLCLRLGIRPVLPADEGVEVTCRSISGRKTYFAINHNGKDAALHLGEGRFTDLLRDEEVTGTVGIPAGEVMIFG